MQLHVGMLRCILLGCLIKPFPLIRGCIQCPMAAKPSISAISGQQFWASRPSSAQQAATHTEDDEDDDYDPYEERAETWQLKMKGNVSW